MALVWPWSVTEPLNPFRALEYFSHFFEKPWREMFDGVAVAGARDAAQLRAETLPAPGAGSLLAARPRRRRGRARGGDAPRYRRRRGARCSCSSPSPALFPIALAVLMRPAMYNGIRHFVFVAPAFAVLGGLAFVWVVGRALGEVWRRRARPCGARVPVRPLPAGAGNGAAAPLSNTRHFNMIAGGMQSAPTNATCSIIGASPSSRRRQDAARASSADADPGHGRRRGASPYAGRSAPPRSNSGRAS